jgi:D-amino-acid dehydrogenase
MLVARSDVLVLGAGIIGTSVALHLVKRGRSVTLVDRNPPGEGTSFGNAGVIGGAGVYPAAFPRRLSSLLRVALRRSPEANYHLRTLPRFMRWLWAYRLASSPKRLEEIARLARPLLAAAVAEHETLMTEANALQFLRKTGWMSVYRSPEAFAEISEQLALAEELKQPAEVLETEAAIALEPHLRPQFSKAILWPDIASVSSPVGVTRAYAAEFAKLGGVFLQADAGTMHRTEGRWRLDTSQGPVDADQAVVALGPWAPDFLAPLGIKLPLGVKRGYHRHYRPQGNALLSRPVLDADIGYVLAPMEHGIRLTTGAEFALRDAPPTPVQFDRVMPFAKGLFPLGEPVEPQPWLGSRPIFPDSMPVIDRAPGHGDLWLAIGHGHMGLTLGPATGRLLSEMISGVTPFVDPAPYRAERFA